MASLLVIAAIACVVLFGISYMLSEQDFVDEIFIFIIVSLLVAAASYTVLSKAIQPFIHRGGV